MKALTAALVALLVVCISSQSYHSVFAVSWLGGFCQTPPRDTSCTDAAYGQWDNLRQSLNIHGLWPDGIRGRNVGRFRLDLFEEEEQLLNDMNTYWPPQTLEDQSEDFLWNHEWTKHGKDYVKILQSYGSDLSEGEYQVQFFRDTIDLFTSFNLRQIPKAKWSKQELADYLGLETNQFYTRCNNKGHLNELRICIEITPGGKRPERCPKVSSNCPNSNSVVDFFGWEGSTSDL